MAKIHEEVLVIKLSKLVKENSPNTGVVTDEITLALEQVVQELVGDSVIVEIERA